MEKWKGIVVVLIIGALGAYGYIASRPPAPNEEPPKPPPGAQALQKLVGQPAPEFGIPAALWTNSKEQVTVDSLKGHVTLIEFWRATCPHCEDAAPFMEMLYEKYGDKGLKIVGIQSPSTNPDPHFVENDWSQVRAVVDQWGITYPVGFDANATLFKESYAGSLYPTVLALDKNGVIRFVETGYDAAKAKQLEQVVQKLLKGEPLEAAVEEAHVHTEGDGHQH